MTAGVVTYETAREGASAVREDPSLADASARLPPGTYTTFRTYGGNGVVRLRAHLRRLEESVSLQGGVGSLDEGRLRASLAAALRDTGHPESRVRLTFSPPRLFISVERFTPPPRSAYERGVRCVTLGVHRENPHAKDTRFIATALDAYRRLPAGVEEGLLIAADGSILEGLSSSFFAVRKGVLHSEDERALRGITRALVIEVAGARMPVSGRAVRTSELPRVSEAFITSVSREVLPVVEIDGDPVGDGRVGPHTRGIAAGFAGLVRREVETLG